MTPNILPAGSNMEGSYRFGAPGAMIRHLAGKKLPLTRADATGVAIGTSFGLARR